MGTIPSLFYLKFVRAELRKDGAIGRWLYLGNFADLDPKERGQASPSQDAGDLVGVTLDTGMSKVDTQVQDGDRDGIIAEESIHDSIMIDGTHYTLDSAQSYYMRCASGQWHDSSNGGRCHSA